MVGSSDGLVALVARTTALRAITVRAAAVCKSRRSPQRLIVGVTRVGADAQIRLRRSVGLFGVTLLLAIDVFATGFFGGSERTLAVVRSIVLPGLPFLEWNWLYGIAAIITALAAIGAWLRWGIDWLPALVMTVCVGIAAFVMPLHHHASADGTPHHVHDGAHHIEESLVLRTDSTVQSNEHGGIVKGSHEFTVVLVVFALLARLRLLFDRLPGSAWIKRQLPEGLFFPAVDIARGAAVALVTGSDRHTVSNALTDPRLRARVSRINRWARFRFRGDPYRRAHAPLRAALSLAQLLDREQLSEFRIDAHARLSGVPESEPTWVRPLDGMLAALALQSLGETDCVERWRSTFQSRFMLSHGRRAAALHTPTMLSIGTATLWEHAATTALGRLAGWLDDADWQHLRRPCLGKAASGAKDQQTLRLIAAGKLWAALTNDAEALEILQRRTVGADSLARALETAANSVRDGEVLR